MHLAGIRNTGLGTAVLKNPGVKRCQCDICEPAVPEFKESSAFIIVELHRERGLLARRMDSIVGSAKDEGRGLTCNERDLFAALNLKYDETEKSIKFFESAHPVTK